MNKIMQCKIIDLPKIRDYRGNLAVIEKEVLPFQMQRVYYLFDVPSDAYRGGHAHIEQQEFLIALSGSFTVKLDDAHEQKEILLNKPDRGLLIKPGIWRELYDFSSAAVCLVISSAPYDEADYIRDYEEFLRFKNR
ncbi:MAG: FdtA/QdtA family cupin domain-containing protein [Flavobacteriaceae bacterium]|nr:FdtA/QdtA family cupin domain-containing protein [Flavobacteriaceae bacterium]